MIFHLIHIEESISLKAFIFIFTAFFYTNCGPVVKNESSSNDDSQNSRPELVNDSSQISKTLIAYTEYKPRRCDGNLVLDIEEDIENLSDPMIYFFLYTFDSICLNNIEFREHSNEVLFKMLERYPESFAIQFDKIGINQSIILNELSNPVHDGINTEKILDVLIKSNIDSNQKQKFLDALRRL